MVTGEICMAEVWIPPLLQKLTGGIRYVTVPGSSVRQIVNNLQQAYPGTKAVLYDEEADRIRPGIAVVVDGEVTHRGLMQQVGENSEVHFLPAIGGGALDTCEATDHQFAESTESMVLEELAWI